MQTLTELYTSDRNMAWLCLFYAMIFLVSLVGGQDLQKAHFQVDHEAGKLDIQATKDSADIEFTNDNLDLLLKPGETQRPAVKPKEVLHGESSSRHELPIKNDPRFNYVSPPKSSTDSQQEIESSGVEGEHTENVIANESKNSEDNKSEGTSKDFTWKGRIKPEEHSTSTHVLDTLNELKDLVAGTLNKTKIQSRFMNTKSQDENLNVANAVIKKIENQQGDGTSSFIESHPDDVFYVNKAQEILNNYHNEDGSLMNGEKSKSSVIYKNEEENENKNEKESEESMMNNGNHSDKNQPSEEITQVKKTDDTEGTSLPEPSDHNGENGKPNYDKEKNDISRQKISKFLSDTFGFEPADKAPHTSDTPHEPVVSTAIVKDNDTSDASEVTKAIEKHVDAIEEKLKKHESLEDRKGDDEISENSRDLNGKTKNSNEKPNTELYHGENGDQFRTVTTEIENTKRKDGYTSGNQKEIHASIYENETDNQDTRKKSTNQNASGKINQSIRDGSENKEPGYHSQSVPAVQTSKQLLNQLKNENNKENVESLSQKARELKPSKMNERQDNEMEIERFTSNTSSQNQDANNTSSQNQDANNANSTTEDSVVQHNNEQSVSDNDVTKDLNKQLKTDETEVKENSTEKREEDKFSNQSKDEKAEQAYASLDVDLEAVKNASQNVQKENGAKETSKDPNMEKVYGSIDDITTKKLSNGFHDNITKEETGNHESESYGIVISENVKNESESERNNEKKSEEKNKTETKQVKQEETPVTNDDDPEMGSGSGDEEEKQIDAEKEESLKKSESKNENQEKVKDRKLEKETESRNEEKIENVLEKQLTTANETKEKTSEVEKNSKKLDSVSKEETENWKKYLYEDNDDYGSENDLKHERRQRRKIVAWVPAKFRRQSKVRNKITPREDLEKTTSNKSEYESIDSEKDKTKEQDLEEEARIENLETAETKESTEEALKDAKKLAKEVAEELKETENRLKKANLVLTAQNHGSSLQRTVQTDGKRTTTAHGKNKNKKNKLHGKEKRKKTRSKNKIFKNISSGDKRIAETVLGLLDGSKLKSNKDFFNTDKHNHRTFNRVHKINEPGEKREKVRIHAKKNRRNEISPEVINAMSELERLMEEQNEAMRRSLSKNDTRKRNDISRPRKRVLEISNTARSKISTAQDTISNQQKGIIMKNSNSTVAKKTITENKPFKKLGNRNKWFINKIQETEEDYYVPGLSSSIWNKKHNWLNATANKRSNVTMRQGWGIERDNFIIDQSSNNRNIKNLKSSNSNTFGTGTKYINSYNSANRPYGTSLNTTSNIATVPSKVVYNKTDLEFLNDSSYNQLNRNTLKLDNSYNYTGSKFASVQISDVNMNAFNEKSFAPQVKESEFFVTLGNVNAKEMPYPPYSQVRTNVRRINNTARKSYSENIRLSKTAHSIAGTKRNNFTSIVSKKGKPVKSNGGELRELEQALIKKFVKTRELLTKRFKELEKVSKLRKSNPTKSPNKTKDEYVEELLFKKYAKANEMLTKKLDRLTQRLSRKEVSNVNLTDDIRGLNENFLRTVNEVFARDKKQMEAALKNSIDPANMLTEKKIKNTHSSSTKKDQSHANILMNNENNQNENRETNGQNKVTSSDQYDMFLKTEGNRFVVPKKTNENVELNIAYNNNTEMEDNSERTKTGAELNDMISLTSDSVSPPNTVKNDDFLPTSKHWIPVKFTGDVSEIPESFATQKKEKAKTGTENKDNTLFLKGTDEDIYTTQEDNYEDDVLFSEDNEKQNKGIKKTKSKTEIKKMNKKEEENRNEGFPVNSKVGISRFSNSKDTLNENLSEKEENSTKKNPTDDEMENPTANQDTRSKTEAQQLKEREKDEAPIRKIDSTQIEDVKDIENNTQTKNENENRQGKENVDNNEKNANENVKIYYVEGGRTEKMNTESKTKENIKEDQNEKNNESKTKENEQNDTENSNSKIRVENKIDDDLDFGFNKVKNQTFQNAITNKTVNVADKEDPNQATEKMNKADSTKIRIKSKLTEEHQKEIEHFREAVMKLKEKYEQEDSKKQLNDGEINKLPLTEKTEKSGDGIKSNQDGNYNNKSKQESSENIQSSGDYVKSKQDTTSDVNSEEKQTGFTGNLDLKIDDVQTESPSSEPNSKSANNREEKELLDDPSENSDKQFSKTSTSAKEQNDDKSDKSLEEITPLQENPSSVGEDTQTLQEDEKKSDKEDKKFSNSLEAEIISKANDNNYKDASPQSQANKDDNKNGDKETENNNGNSNSKIVSDDSVNTESSIVAVTDGNKNNDNSNDDKKDSNDSDVGKNETSKTAENSNITADSNKNNTENADVSVKENNNNKHEETSTENKPDNSATKKETEDNTSMTYKNNQKTIPEEIVDPYTTFKRSKIFHRYSR